MKSMEFGIFVWQENPEKLKIEAVRVPEYVQDDTGDYAYTGLGPLCRTISGSGVFHGEFAYENFNTLQVLMATGASGTLSHPIWGSIKAYLTYLEMDQESREGYVAYSFSFREADDSGTIPRLPGNWQSEM